MPTKLQELKAGVLTAGIVIVCLGIQPAVIDSTAVAQAGGADPELKPLPAAVRPPPELGAEGHEKPTAPPRRRASVDELLRVVGGQPGGRETLEMARAGRPGQPLPAVAAGPQELREVRSAPPVPRRPNVDQLLDIVRRQPGGVRKVDAARGRDRSQGSDDRNSSRLLAWLSRVNPFRVEAASAATGFSIGLNYKNGWSSSSPYAWAKFFGESGISSHDPPSPWLRGYAMSSGWGSFGHSIRNPLVSIHLRAPSSGWYVINVVNYGEPGFTAQMRHRGDGSYPILAEFQGPRAWGTWLDHPTLVYLSSGNHYFYYVVTSGMVSVASVNIDQL